MSTDNDKILTHPAFDRAPVVNPKTRGRPRGTLSFRTALRGKVAAQLRAERDRAMESVAPDLRALYAKTDAPSVAKAIGAQRDRVFEVGSIVAVVAETLRRFSGDEESALAIVEQLSTQCYALDGAYRLSNEVNEQLELIGRNLE